MGGPQPKNISVCVLNWENYPDTRKCINALLELPEIADLGYRVHILVIDNCSMDGSFERLEEFVASRKYPHIGLLRSEENRGYAAGNNLGIKYSLEQLAASYIWILNNDTVPLPGSLGSLVEAAQKDRSVAIWGSSLIDEETGESQCAGGYYYNSWLGTIKPAFAGYDRDKLLTLELSRPLDYIAGAAMFIRGGLFARRGYLEESYFLYCEELDLAHRLSPDEHISWCRESLVLHRGGASLPGQAGKRSEITEYYSILSSLKFTRKFYPVRLLTVMPVLFFGKLIIYLMNGETRLAGVLIKSFRTFLR